MPHDQWQAERLGWGLVENLCMVVENRLTGGQLGPAHVEDSRFLTKCTADRKAALVRNDEWAGEPSHAIPLESRKASMISAISTLLRSESGKFAFPFTPCSGRTKRLASPPCRLIASTHFRAMITRTRHRSCPSTSVHMLSRKIILEL